MRNIAIADPRDRVSESPDPVRPARRPSRLRDWLATLPIILLVPALVVPFAVTSAGEPTLEFSPATGSAGVRITIVGTSFGPGEVGELRWTADDSTFKPYDTNMKGRLRVRAVVPKTMEPGKHELAAVDAAGTVRATATFEILGADAMGALVDREPKSQKSPKPRPTRKPKATPAPTAAPAATDAPAATPTPTPKPTAIAAPTPTVAPAPTATPAPAPTATPIPTPKPTATAAPTATVAPAPTPTPAPVFSGGWLVMSAIDIARLPASGAAWTALKSRADGSAASPDISNQDDGTDLVVLAKALVYARTGTTSYRTAAYQAIKAAVGTEAGGRTLALGRNLPGYVLAADLIGLSSLDPSFDTNVFRPWLRGLLSATLDGRTLRSTHEDRPNNWGTHAGAARAAIAGYLGDTTEMAGTATVFRGWLGDRSAYAGFSWGDLSWQCNAAKPVGINPSGCTKNGVVIDGALPDDMRRGGTFQWPPAFTGYAWEALQGAVLQAELLRRAGYDTWNWSDRALLRATRFLYDRAGWPAEGDDEWQPWLIDRRYGTSYRDAAPARTGKNFGYTDWLYGS